MSADTTNACKLALLRELLRRGDAAHITRVVEGLDWKTLVGASEPDNQAAARGADTPWRRGYPQDGLVRSWRRLAGHILVVSETRRLSVGVGPDVAWTASADGVLLADSDGELFFYSESATQALADGIGTGAFEDHSFEEYLEEIGNE